MLAPHNEGTGKYFFSSSVTFLTKMIKIITEEMCQYKNQQLQGCRLRSLRSNHKNCYVYMLIYSLFLLYDIAIVAQRREIAMI